MEKEKVYFNNIDFLRVLLCLCIIMRHIANAISHSELLRSVPVYDNIYSYNTFGNIPVDCFFIISGFFLFFTTDFMQSFYKFALKKLARLLPVIVFAEFLYLILHAIFLHRGITITKDIWTIFMLHNVGLTDQYTTLANTWFVSVLFWVSCLYFYLYKIIDKNRFNFILACTVFAGYAFYLHSSLDNYQNVCYIINHGAVRGLAGMALGYLIFNLYQDVLKNLKFSKPSIIRNLNFTLLEGFLLAFVFINMIYQITVYKDKLFIISAFALLMILFIMKQGYISKLFDNKIFAILGKYTYSIYITHVIVRNLWAKYFIKHCETVVLAHPLWNIAVIYLIAIGLGIFTYYIIERNAAKYFTNKLKNIEI